MKNIILLVIILGFSFFTKAQEIEYIYDDAGNRLIRKVVNMPISLDTTIHDSLTIHSEILTDNSISQHKENDPGVEIESSNPLGASESKRQKDEKVFEDKLGEVDIAVFPNPTSGKININISGLDSNGKNWLRLYDLNGKLLESEEGLSETNKIDLTPHQPGVFILKINTNGESSEWKIIRQ